MELKEFIKEVLLEITQAVEEAQNEGQNKNDVSAVISPTITADNRAIINGVHRSTTDIYFDVQIAVSEGNDGEGGIGIKVAQLFNASATANSSSRNELTQRIQFRVPVALPSVKTEFIARGKIIKD